MKYELIDKCTGESMILEGKVYIVIEKDNPNDPIYEVFGCQQDYSDWYMENYGNPSQGYEDYEKRFMLEVRTVNFSVNVEINQ